MKSFWEDKEFRSKVIKLLALITLFDVVGIIRLTGFRIEDPFTYILVLIGVFSLIGSTYVAKIIYEVEKGKIKRKFDTQKIDSVSRTLWRGMYIIVVVTVILFIVLLIYHDKGI